MFARASLQARCRKRVGKSNFFALPEDVGCESLVVSVISVLKAVTCRMRAQNASVTSKYEGARGEAANGEC